MVGLLDQELLQYLQRQQRGGGFPAALPPLSPEMAAASQPAIAPLRLDMGQTPKPFGPFPDLPGLLNGGMFNASPMAMPLGGPMVDPTNPPYRANPPVRPVTGVPTVTSLDGGSPIPLPTARPSNLGTTADEMSGQSRSGAPAGMPMSLAPPMPGPAMPSAGPLGGGGAAPAAGGGLRMPSAAMLLAMGAGFSGASSFGEGMRRASAGAADVLQGEAANEQKAGAAGQNQKAVYDALVEKGVPRLEAIAASRNNTMLEAVTKKYLTPTEVKPPQIKDFKNANNETVYRQFNPRSGQYDLPVPGFESPVSNEKKIPDKLADEVATRLGLAKSFLGQLPDIMKRVEAGDATGPIDAIMGRFGAGAAGELRRQVSSGSEALLRNLTGAGMGVQEANKYVKRYEIEDLDTAASVKSKLTQLERELKVTMDVVTRGRPALPTIGPNGQLVFAPGDFAAPKKQPTGSVTVGGRQMEWSLE